MSLPLNAPRNKAKQTCSAYILKRKQQQQPQQRQKNRSYHNKSKLKNKKYLFIQMWRVDFQDGWLGILNASFPQ